jgi:hypothetical protein
MILEGVLCESCGEYIGEPVGYPRECRSCKAATGEILPPDEDDFDDDAETD